MQRRKPPLPALTVKLSKYNVDDVALGVCKTGAEEAGVTEVRTSLSEKKFELWQEVFFFNDTTPPEIYTLSLHDALPLSSPRTCGRRLRIGPAAFPARERSRAAAGPAAGRAQAAARHPGEWRHAARRLLLAAQQGDPGGGVVPARGGGVCGRHDEADRGAAEEALRRDALADPGGRLDRAGADRLALVLPADGEGEAVPDPVPQTGAGRRGAGRPRPERSGRGQEIPRPGRVGGERRREPARVHDR